MWAGTVVAPPWPTSAAIDSVTSRSRSVALKASVERSALIRTLARIGMVFRRSTTRWTWLSDFSRAARSTVTFMSDPARFWETLSKGVRKWRGCAHFARVRGALPTQDRDCQWRDRVGPGARRPGGLGCQDRG